MAPPSPRRPGDVEPSRSFDLVADAYDRGRPSYPDDAVRWLVGGAAGQQPERIVELGAGTGKLTESLTRHCHDVLATDPSPALLERLRRRAPKATVSVGSAENIPVFDRSTDLVVAAQAAHWFDQERALPEIARVLRAGGAVALVWNERDERIPWVRRLGNLLGAWPGPGSILESLQASPLFADVESKTFRFWQRLNDESLVDLVVSHSGVATLPEEERQRLMSDAAALYDEYGRGADGMLLPYITHAYRVALSPEGLALSEPAQAEPTPEPSPVHPDDVDTDALLIDFR